MGQVALTLLGGFEARTRLGVAVAVPTRKAQALLAYLALTPDQGHPREKLTALLWPDRPRGVGRTALRQTLFLLRRALGPVEPDLVATTGEGVTLTPGAVETDVAAFERAMADGLPALETATELYRGDLLAGLGTTAPPFEDWLMSERERLRELALEALARLLAQQRAAGETGPAVQSARRLLALDPVQEAVHRTLMRLYAQAGRRGDALRQYRECVAVLQHELAVEPEVETRQLYQEILRERVSQPVRVDRDPTAADPITTPPRAPLAPALAEAPLVGRAAELDRLRAALDTAWAGHPQLFLVRGEAGIGKSRLIAEVAAPAARSGGHVLVGQCHESDQALPFGPWVDLLRAALAELGPRLDGLAAPWRTELTRLLPELVDTAAPADTPMHHRRLFEAVAACIQHVARSRPVLLILEDLHWADEPSLRLLASLSRRLADVSALILASVREEDLADTPERLQVLDIVGEAASTLTLGPLSRPDTARLVAALSRCGADVGTTSQLADRVWTVSEGHPLMVVEATRVYGVEPDALATGPALPDRIHDLVTRRLRRVSDAGRTVLAAAAVAGRQVDFAVLERAAGLGEADAAAAVEELVRRRLLREAGEGLVFTHDRVREVVYGGLLAPRRRLLHKGTMSITDGTSNTIVQPSNGIIAILIGMRRGRGMGTMQVLDGDGKPVFILPYIEQDNLFRR